MRSTPALLLGLVAVPVRDAGAAHRLNAKPSPLTRAAPAAATPAPDGDRALRRSSRSDADLDDNLDDGLEETAPDDRESFLGF